MRGVHSGDMWLRQLSVFLFLAVGVWAGLRMVRTALSSTCVSRTVYVAQKGRDQEGYGSSKKPYQTIGYALARATPGTTIVVKSGVYPEHLVTTQNGAPGCSITLTGSAKLTGGAESGRIFELMHDYYVIRGLEFTGKDVLLWMQEADYNTIEKNFFHHAQGECVRAKYHSSHNTFVSNRVENCGIADFVQGGGGKNGEGIYLGTAPEQLNKNPTPETDQTSFNVVRSNTFVTNGNECVDIKEGSASNAVEYNDCTGQRDPESGGFDSRGNDNVFRYNKSYGNGGAGIRLGGDAGTDGIRNAVYGNTLGDNGGYALKVMRLPQGLICGNAASGNALGFTNEPSVTNPPCAF